jgi:hypothetical protein
MQHNDLKHYGYLYKTDKIVKQGYHRFYHKELVEYKHKTFGMIEIGVDHFKSIDMWKQYFPKAFIYAVDPTIRYEDQRIKIMGSVDKSQISHPIYVIVDGGSHSPSNQIHTFNNLFGMLNAGGTYIMEDIEFSYWKENESTVDKFKILIDYVNSYYLKDKEQLDEKTNFVSREIKDSILSITFAPNCIIIKKKSIHDELYTKQPYEFIDRVK